MPGNMDAKCPGASCGGGGGSVCGRERGEGDFGVVCVCVCVCVCVMVVGGGAAVEMPLAQASACIPSFDRRASQHVGALTFESLRTPDDEV